MKLRINNRRKTIQVFFSRAENEVIVECPKRDESTAKRYIKERGDKLAQFEAQKQKEYRSITCTHEYNDLTDIVEKCFDEAWATFCKGFCNPSFVKPRLLIKNINKRKVKSWVLGTYRRLGHEVTLDKDFIEHCISERHLKAVMIHELVHTIEYSHNKNFKLLLAMLEPKEEELCRESFDVIFKEVILKRSVHS